MKEKEREKDENEKDRDKEREREKCRDKDRDREKDREKIREREKEKEKEKLKAKEKDRDFEKKKDRAKEPEREKDSRIREHDRDRGKDQEREKERVKDTDRERNKDRERDVDKEKKKEKDRFKKDRDKEREKEKERDREKEKAGEREKHGEREKEREKIGEREKDREKLGERDKDKERDNVVDREKEREKAGEREKEREKEREREKEKEREREERERQKSRIKEKDRGREHDRERDGRDRDREHDRDREGRDKEREHERDMDRDREERDRDRQKEREHELEGRERKRDDKPTKNSTNSQASTAVLEERIAKMREERQRASAKKSDAEDDIKSWVNKSRILEQQKKREEMEKAARMAKILSEQDVEEESDDSDSERGNSRYGGKDLAGLKVRHGLDKVMEGGAVVLTLKDSSVLDGDDVNEATDELENIEMSEQISRNDAYKAAKKKTGIYEDKFNNDINAPPRTILPQYDDAVRDEGVVLDETGGINEESRRKLEEARRRLESVSAKESLHSTLNIASDYFTQEDMLQFRKPKKKKKLRKKDKLDLDELEAEAVAAGLGKEDLGSRNSEARTERKQLEAKAEAEAKKHAYEVALKKGQDASRMLKEESTAQPMEIETPLFGGEEEEDLYKSLEKARQAALKKLRETAGPQSIAARVVALNEEGAQTSQSSSGLDTDESRLVFTDTGEFCRSLQLDDVSIRKAGGKDAFGEEDEEAPPVEMEEDTAKAAGGWTEVFEADKTLPSPQVEDDAAPGEEPITEVSVGKGLAGALMLLKERGTLKETVDWGGRNMDKKRSKLVGIVDESNNQVGQRDILLDRVDEFGRTMTPKEAFRKLSHKFHGKGPGKMKQEKRMKQWQEELRLKQMNSGDTPLMSMEKMREAQAKMHTPYIVISGHIKPGQTSDPRSGFATVEKEPIGSLTPMLGDKVGSLTPMLGDKKVEHFLGIKRKAEPGSMGPPPPKQPKLDRQ